MKCLICKTETGESWKKKCLNCFKNEKNKKIKKNCVKCDISFIGESWKKECFECYNVTGMGNPIMGNSTQCNKCGKYKDYVGDDYFMCMNGCI